MGRIDLILACGDLPYYLEYIVSSLLDRPLLPLRQPRQGHPAPAGLESLSGPPSLGWAVNLHPGHEKAVPGFAAGGKPSCRVYNPGAPYRCEAQVRTQIRQFGNCGCLRIGAYGRYLDILITYARRLAGSGR